MSNSGVAIPTWTQVLATSEYQADYQNVLTVLTGSFGGSSFTAQNAFVQLVAQLIAVHRYYVRHIADFKDIDKTYFFKQVANEVGFDLPIISDYSATELLRENKTWYSMKGTNKMFPFAGDLIGSPLEIDYPSDQIMRFDDANTLLDGAVGTGPTSWAESKIGHYQDGTFYWPFVYIVRVLQAQNVKNFNDLVTILDNVNPVGMLYVLYFEFNWIVDMTNIPVPTVSASYEREDWFVMQSAYPTYDNGLKFDDINSLYDENAANWALFGFNWEEIQPLAEDSVYQRLSYDRAFNKSLPANINHVFSTGETTLQVSATGNVVPNVYNVTQHKKLMNGVDFSVDPNTTVLTWITVPTNGDTILVEYPWITFSRDIASYQTATITGEAHTYSTGQSTLQLNTVGKGLSTVPNVVNTTHSITYQDGIDYTFNSDTGLITWITIPANNDVITCGYTYFTQKWQTLYSATDSIVYENVTTNVGLKNYTYSVWANLTYQEIQDAAWDLDQQNMRGQYLNEHVFSASIS